MNRFLFLAEFLFGDETRQRVFDPLVADAQEEIRRSRVPALARVRWQLAMIIALVSCSPRMALMPMPLLIDLVVRSVTFGALAVTLQLAFAWSGRRGVPITFTSTLPFIVTPVVWRIHVSSLALHQRRFLALMIAAVSAMAMAGLTDAAPSVRAALVAMVVGCSWIGWRIGDPGYGVGRAPVMNSVLMRGLMMGSWYQVASWLPLFASGQSVLDSYWPGRTLFTYVIGIAISASVIKRWHARENEEALDC